MGIEPPRQDGTAEVQRAVLDALRSLDGTTKSAALTGLSDAEIEELGGLDH